MKKKYYRLICHIASLILSLSAMAFIIVEYCRSSCPTDGNLLVILFMGSAVYWIVFALLSGDWKGLL